MTNKDWKVFYSYLHRSAREEKIAYATERNQTVVPFLYEVMENFLHNKRLDKYDDIFVNHGAKKILNDKLFFLLYIYPLDFVFSEC